MAKTASGFEPKVWRWVTIEDKPYSRTELAQVSGGVLVRCTTLSYAISDAVGVSLVFVPGVFVEDMLSSEPR